MRGCGAHKKRVENRKRQRVSKHVAPSLQSEGRTHPMACTASWHSSMTFMTALYSPSTPVPSAFACGQQSGSRPVQPSLPMRAYIRGAVAPDGISRQVSSTRARLVLEKTSGDRKRTSYLSPLFSNTRWHSAIYLDTPTSWMPIGTRQKSAAGEAPRQGQTSGPALASGGFGGTSREAFGTTRRRSERTDCVHLAMRKVRRGAVAIESREKSHRDSSCRAAVRRRHVITRFPPRDELTRSIYPEALSSLQKRVESAWLLSKPRLDSDSRQRPLATQSGTSALNTDTGHGPPGPSGFCARNNGTQIRGLSREREA